MREALYQTALSLVHLLNSEAKMWHVIVLTVFLIGWKC